MIVLLWGCAMGAKILNLAKALISLRTISRDTNFYEGTAQISWRVANRKFHESDPVTDYGHCHSRNEHRIRRWLVAEPCSQLHLVSSFKPMNI